MTTRERSKWSKKAEFILVSIGTAAGLGNIWRFPSLCYEHGGGSFLLSYVIMMILVGLPLNFLETSVGQFSNFGPISIWKSSPIFKGIGYTMIACSSLIGCYYDVIATWSLFYLYSSCTASVPWEGCDNDWNTPYCIDDVMLQFDAANETSRIENKNLTSTGLKYPSEEYFYRKVLQISDGINEIGSVVWQLAVCLTLLWAITFLILLKGANVLGKIVYFTSIFPYVMLTIMLIRGMTLEGGREGVIFYLKPDWSKFKEANLWIDSTIQAIVSLGACSGNIIMIASYNDFHNCFSRDAVILTVMNCITSMYSGLALFSIIGHLTSKRRISVAQVTVAGPGLIFTVYTEGLRAFPFSPVWSFLFFLMLIASGLDSMLPTFECFFCSFHDEFQDCLRTPRRVIIFKIIICMTCFLTSLVMITNGGFYVIQLLDSTVCGFPLLIIGLLEIISLTYVYGFDRLSRDIELMTGSKPNIFFRITWMVVSPVLILVMIIFLAMNFTPPILNSASNLAPFQTEMVGWSIVGLLLSIIPLFGVYHYCRHGGCQAFKLNVKPTQDWGPASVENRSGRYDRPIQIKWPTSANKIKGKTINSSLPTHINSKASVVRDAIFNGDVNLAVVVATDNGVVTTDEVYDMVVKGNVNQGYQGDGFKVEQRPEVSDEEASVEGDPVEDLNKPKVEDLDIDNPDIADVEDPVIGHPKIGIVLPMDNDDLKGPQTLVPKPLARKRNAGRTQDTSL